MLFRLLLDAGACTRRGRFGLAASYWGLPLAALLLLFTSSVYGQGQVVDKTMSYGGLQRLYSLYVPSSYTHGDNLPLVVNMHGITLNREFQMSHSGMNDVAEREGFLVAYPDAVDSNWFGPQDNIGFIDRLIDHVSSQYSVNNFKVYATGFSQGGIMSYMLSVARPNRFAAVASVGAFRPFDGETDFLYPRDLPEVPDRRFPLLQIQGTSDVITPYLGGRGAFDARYLPVEELLAKYVLNNGGDPTPTITNLPNTNTTDGSTVQLLSYDGGTYLDSAGNSREAEVLLYRINGGGHSWPGDYPNWDSWALPVNRDFNASEAIWDFFSHHEVAAIPEPDTLAFGVVAVTLTAWPILVMRWRRRLVDG
jgi:polyhydroxybutyrate depolymerase